MQCFSFAEQAVPFLRGMLDEEGDPVVLTPEGCGLPIILGEAFTQQISKAAQVAATERVRFTNFRLGYNPSKRYPMSEYERRIGVALEMEMNTLVLKPAPRYRKRRQEQALVRIETAGGDGGRVQLTSCVHDEEMKGARVVENYNQFPSMGIQPICTDETLQKVNGGVEVLDLFILMNPGSRFRIQRSGALGGAKRFINVSWTGDELRPMAPRYEDRVVGNFAAA